MHVAYASAKQVLEAGHEGKWIKVTAEEEKNIIDSIPGENLIRGTRGQGPLRHYTDRGHIVIHHRGLEADVHPLDKKPAA